MYDSKQWNADVGIAKLVRCKQAGKEHLAKISESPLRSGENAIRAFLMFSPMVDS